MLCTLLSIIFDLRYYKAYRQLRQKAITTPNNLSPKILPITDKNGTVIPDGAAVYLACFLGFSILIFHKCNIARILVVQQILHQVCSLKLHRILWVAVQCFASPHFNRIDSHTSKAASSVLFGELYRPQ